MAAQDAEIARLKGIKIRPHIQPSGLEQEAKPPSASPSGPRRGGGPRTSPRTIHADRVIQAAPPPGSRFKGFQA